MHVVCMYGWLYRRHLESVELGEGSCGMGSVAKKGVRKSILAR